MRRPNDPVGVGGIIIRRGALSPAERSDADQRASGTSRAVP
jgi:hypothetical protein